ncbi:ATP-binding protein [Nostoc sp.]|uniref:ATP-binding protein n=1 Tax=Nostoc sp. TaxID=1180 RepID=UPI002FF5D266
MTDDEVYKPPFLVFTGQKINAIYSDPEVSKYRGNPLIEALPKILTKLEAAKGLAKFPHYSEDMRNQPAHLRLHYIQDTLEFFTPLGIHIDLEQRISRIIRLGYQARNPILPQFWQNTKRSLDLIDPNGFVPRSPRSTAKSMTIIGLSGIGKSTGVEEILLLYPQIINHSRYLNKNLTLRQIVWLKLDCPYDGSIKGLCINFFQAVDDLLGTQYYTRYTKGRQTVDDMIPNMARVASIQSLGMLVIDEIQNLSLAKSGGCQKMLNFFVQLINTIGLPVIFVGTYKAWSVLSSQFRQIRRGTGQGDFVWDTMKEDETWQTFVKSLWRYQYVQIASPLTPELSHTLYYECQGITDFAAKIYMLAQVRAVSSGKERITASIIKSVAKDCLRTATKVLNALKEKDADKKLRLLMDCEDVKPIDLEPFIEEGIERLANEDSSSVIGEDQSDSESSPSEEIKQTELSQELSELVNSKLLKEKEISSTSVPIKATQKSRTSNKQTDSKDTLPEIVAEKASVGLSGYEALKEAGYIKSVSEYQL